MYSIHPKSFRRAGEGLHAAEHVPYAHYDCLVQLAIVKHHRQWLDDLSGSVAGPRVHLR